LGVSQKSFSNQQQSTLIEPEENPVKLFPTLGAQGPYLAEMQAL